MKSESAWNNEPRLIQLLSAGGRVFGVIAAEVDAIINWRRPTPLPNAPAGVLGVVCSRGRMLTVLASGVLLEEEGAAPTKIVALVGDEQIAIAVDGIGEVVEIAQNEIETADVNGLILAQVQAGEKALAVLNSKQLFATAMRGRERRRRNF